MSASPTDAIATTRPETILGDSAICINPNDKRYTHLKGKKVFVPLNPSPLYIEKNIDYFLIDDTIWTTYQQTKDILTQFWVDLPKLV